MNYTNLGKMKQNELDVNQILLTSFQIICFIMFFFSERIWWVSDVVLSAEAILLNI